MKLNFDRILNFQNRLITCLCTQGSLQDLLEIAHDEFQRPMFIKGDGNTIYAITKNYSPDVHPSWTSFVKNLENKMPEFDSIRVVSEDPQFQEAFSRKESMILQSPSYGGMVLHTNVWMNERRICEIIVLENGKPFYQSDTELMDIFSSYVRLHITINKDRYITASDPVTAFQSLLDLRSLTPLEIVNINNLTGWSNEDEFAVITADTSSKSNTPLLAVFRDKLRSLLTENVTFLHEDHVVCVVNLTRSGGYSAVSRQIGKLILNESFHCGMSFEYTGIERTIEFYNLARLACSIAERLDRKFLDMYTAAPMRISERMHAISDLQALIHPDLLRLDRLDPHRTSHYLETLYAYLICGGNYTDTANYLGLHRNSLIYRMNRIQSIITSDLNNVHNKHFLLISYLLMGISF